VYTSKSFAHKIVLRGFSSWIFIQAQVLDGPPGITARRLSTFLLIPVGFNRQGFAFWGLPNLPVMSACPAIAAPIFDARGR
jgi:hypothetical protein